MADPLHLRQSYSAGSDSGRKKGLSKILSKIRHPFSQASQKNIQGLGQDTFNPSPEGNSSSNHTRYFKKKADVAYDYADLLEKNKTLQTEVKNLQQKLLIKESSLEKMKFQLEKSKENNARQSSQILCLRDHIMDLEKFNASGKIIKSLTSASIKEVEKSNRLFSERVVELENHLRIELLERQNAEQKAASLEKKLMDTTRKLSSIINMDIEGQDDPLEVLVMKVRNIQNRLLTKESCLRDLTFKLENYKEYNARQSSQIRSLKDHIKDLEKINSVNRIKSLKNTSIENTEKGNRDLCERIVNLENDLRVQFIEREKAEKEAESLETLFMDTKQKLASFMDSDMEEQDDFLESLAKKENEEAFLDKKLERENIFLLESLKDGQKTWNSYQGDKFHKEKHMSGTDHIPLSLKWEAETPQTHFQSFIIQLANLLSNNDSIVPATEETVRERIQEMITYEQSWKYKNDVLQQEIQLLNGQVQKMHQLYQEAEENLPEEKESLDLSEEKVDSEDIFQVEWDLDTKTECIHREKNEIETFQTKEMDKNLRQLEKEKKQQNLMTIENSLQRPQIVRLKEGIVKLPKDFSDIELSTQSMKTQLKIISDIKDKGIAKLQKSLKTVEMIRKKATTKEINLKTLDHPEQETREDEERAYPMLEAVTNDPYPMKKALEEVAEQQKQLMDFIDSLNEDDELQEFQNSRSGNY